MIDRDRNTIERMNERCEAYISGQMNEDEREEIIMNYDFMCYLIHVYIALKNIVQNNGRSGGRRSNNEWRVDEDDEDVEYGHVVYVGYEVDDDDSNSGDEGDEVDDDSEYDEDEELYEYMYVYIHDHMNDNSNNGHDNYTYTRNSERIV